MTFAIYPPAGAGLPWLAVVLDGKKPLDMFGCESRTTAERVLRSMRARHSYANDRDLRDAVRGDRLGH